MTEYEFRQVSAQNWDISMKSENPPETYRKLQSQIEEAMSPDSSSTLSPDRADWYRAD